MSLDAIAITHLYTYDLELWPLISDLNIFAEIPTRMMNICAKFHWNPSTDYREVASREIGVNGRTDVRPENLTPPYKNEAGRKARYVRRW